MKHCEEKARLAVEYQAATKKFSEAVTDLITKMGVSLIEEYKLLEHIANDARVKSEQARLALEQHSQAHGC